MFSNIEALLVQIMIAMSFIFIGFPNFYLVPLPQCFSTGVPWIIFRCAAKS